jgi:hypothetical protein
MNGWDLFTWICSVALGVSAILIFCFFLRDAGDLLKGKSRELDDSED